MKNIINKIIRNKNKKKNIIVKNKIVKNKKKNKIFKNKIVKNKKIKNNPIKKRRKKNKINIMITSTEKNTKLEKNSKINFIKKKNNKTFLKYNNNIKNQINYNDYELNNLSYKRALELDKRTYFQYYFSLLKMKHILIFTFYTNNDYNSKYIKIILFLFSFSLHFTINTLFFNDQIFHKIYEDQGDFNFIYKIPYILYSTIISSFINVIIQHLSLTEDIILKIKKEKNIVIEKKTKILKNIIINLVIFFILIFLFLFLFWLYLTCFCGVYKNSQIHAIKDTLISYGLSLLYPFLLYLLPGIFRIPSINSKNKECLFKISKLIQLL